MSPEKTKELVSKYPKIFDENFYFECGDGWFNLIDCLCYSIQTQCNYLSVGKSEEEIAEIQTTARQVKEKFGGLRFYAMTNDEMINGMIQVVESISYRTCEGCGNVGSIYKDGWVRTNCRACEQEYQNRRNKVSNGSIT